MLTWIIQISIISIIFIFLVHHLLLFFKATLTVPKIKDLVNSPTQKYQNIFDTISNKNNSYSSIDLLPTSEFSSNPDFLSNLQEVSVESKSMKDELKNFLKKQLNNSNDNIVGIDTINNF
jgi:cell shape-determining protein MreC